jgi:hypothetical protein
MLWQVLVSPCIFMLVPDDGFMEKPKHVALFWTIEDSV